MEGGQPSNPFPGGSPTGSPTAGATTELGGLEVARRMVEATEAAALAAQKAVEMVQSTAKSTSDDSKSWWKLLPKPPTFDHGTREAEIAAWKEWSWMFELYM